MWTKGDRKAIVLGVNYHPAPGWLEMRALVDGRLGRVAWPSIQAGQPRGYEFRTQQPTLRCADKAAAEAAVAFLHGKGIRPGSAFACGEVVAMTPPSVLRFAEDAYENGWAHDQDCAQMIGDLG